ncbi:MAG: glycosyltransferase, partial [Chloroflexota bacterium]|nr:glycosyltransferase [Chloroflexota bacterium]
MKILFLTPQLPYPPQKGTALRNWGLISGLAEHHWVSLLSFQAPGQDPQPAPELAAACARVDTVPQPERALRDRLRDMLITRQPDMALRLASEPFARQLENWLARESFDVIHIEGIELAPYLDVIEAARPRPLVLFDDHNCEYLLQKRVYLTDLRAPARWPGAAYSFVQWRRLLRYEAHVCRRADYVLAVSEPDAAALQKLAPELDVVVIPNGIDTRAYRLPMNQSPMTNDQIPNPQISKSPTLVFTGTMDFRPNVDAVLWFARKALPLVRAEVADAHFVIVGQR